MARGIAAGLAALALWQAAPAGAEDWAPGEKLSYIHCGRCHVIGERNRWGGIGSTPGFHVIRNWPDWEERMEGFYALNPHPSFTQIEGVTEPFTDARPPHIHPVEITLEELREIIGYARTVPPADLGAPIR